MSAAFRLIPVLTVFLLPATAIGADLQKGLDAYDIGDYEASLAECQPLAEQGDKTAQFCVGRLYASGFGVPMDDALALQWYGLSAEQGYAEAQFNLAVMYANGWGVPVDDVEAAKLFELAAEQGFLQAQTALASVYDCGRGREESPTDAYKWYAIAAQLGDMNAEFKRDEIANKMAGDVLQIAKQMAESWLEAFDSSNIHAGRSD